MNRVEQLREEFDKATEDYQEKYAELAFAEMEKVANTAIEMFEQILNILEKD